MSIFTTEKGYFPIILVLIFNDNLHCSCHYVVEIIALKKALNLGSLGAGIFFFPWFCLETLSLVNLNTGKFLRHCYNVPYYKKARLSLTVAQSELFMRYLISVLISTGNLTIDVSLSTGRISLCYQCVSATE